MSLHTHVCPTCLAEWKHDEDDLDTKDDWTRGHTCPNGCQGLATWKYDATECTKPQFAEFQNAMGAIKSGNADADKVLRALVDYGNPMAKVLGDILRNPFRRFLSGLGNA